MGERPARPFGKRVDGERSNRRRIAHAHGSSCAQPRGSRSYSKARQESGVTWLAKGALGDGRDSLNLTRDSGSGQLMIHILAFQCRRHPCEVARRKRTARMGPSRCRHSSNCEPGGERNPYRPAASSRKAEGFFHRMADRKRCRSQEAESRLDLQGAGMAVACSYSHRARECSSCWPLGSRTV